MKLIPFEELKKAIESCWQLSCIQDENDLFLIRDKFDNLPTIDPISTIDEMIEEYKNSDSYWIAWHIYERIFQELKSRLSLTQK